MQLLTVQWTRLSQVVIYYFHPARIILQNYKYGVDTCVCALKKNEYYAAITRVFVCVRAYVRVGVDVEGRRFLELLTIISKSN